MVLRTVFDDLGGFFWRLAKKLSPVECATNRFTPAFILNLNLMLVVTTLLVEATASDLLLVSVESQM